MLKRSYQTNKQTKNKQQQQEPQKILKDIVLENRKARKIIDTAKWFLGNGGNFGIGVVNRTGKNQEQKMLLQTRDFQAQGYQGTWAS